MGFSVFFSSSSNSSKVVLEFLGEKECNIRVYLVVKD